MALVCTLSVLNGFRDLIGGLYTTFDPVLKVVPAKGKFADANHPVLSVVSADADVLATTACLEDNALVLFQGRPVVIRLKGVDGNFQQTSRIDDILLGNGEYCLQAANIFYGIPGVALAETFGGADYGSIVVAAPKKGERVNTLNPGENFNVEEVFSSGIAFAVNQRRYDETTLLVSIELARRLFEQEGRITSLELALRSGSNVTAVKKRLQTAVGEEFRVLDRVEQQQETFALMNIEKTITWLLLAFIALVACFNVIGAVSMLIIDKRDDVKTLRALGLSERGITRIFLLEGRMITVIGAVVGVILGVGLCLAQQHFGMLRLGSSENFIVTAYPVSVYATDVLLTFITVIAVGFLSVWYPVHYICKRLLSE